MNNSTHVKCAFHLCLIFFSLWLAWIILALFNFGYAFWYEVLHIQAFIEELGPQNRYKSHFHLLNKQDYVELFKSINQAIHLAPQTLQDIQYTVTIHNQQLQIHLLRPPEVIHLQDVARLITVLHMFGFINAVLIGLYYYSQKRKVAPDQKARLWQSESKYFMMSWGLLLGIAVSIALTNPTAIFYWFHEIAFPDNHQWFFYYQESLMTTLMKAPDLFGGIALLLLGCTFILHFMLYKLIAWRLKL